MVYEIDAQRVAFIQELKSLVRATISLSHHDAEGTESGLLFRSQQAFELINWLQSVKSLDLYHHSLQVCMPSFYFFLCLFFYTFCCFSLPKVLQPAMSILSSKWRFLFTSLSNIYLMLYNYYKGTKHDCDWMVL